MGLAIRVVYRGCAVPVAWKVLKAQEKHAWKPMSGVVETVSRSFARRLDGDRVGGSWLLCGVVVCSHRRTEGASVSACQHPRRVASRQRVSLEAVFQPGAY